jgi:hypothetical protein
MVIRLVYLAGGSSIGAHDRFYPLLMTWIFPHSKVWRPLWREDECVICFSVNRWSRSLRTHNLTLLYHSRLVHLYPWALGFLSISSYVSQGLWWHYSNLSPHHAATILSYDRRTVGQSVWVSGDNLGPAIIFFTSTENICRHLWISSKVLHLWPEGGSAIYSCKCYWTFPVLSVSVPSSAVFETYLTLSFEAGCNWQTRPGYYTSIRTA